MSKQQVQIPAIQLPIFGLKDQSHLIRHQQKMQICPLDAGIDLFPSSISKVIEYLGWYDVWISTMVHMVFQPGTYGRITDRSSTAKVTSGATVIPGVIDAGYTGEIIVRLMVIMPRPYDNFENSLHPVAVALKECISQQIPIAQIVPSPALVGMMAVVDPNKLPNYGRGNNGFGSTNSIGK
jgi:dUTPase